MSAPALLFAIRGEGSETLEIDVYDTIGESWWGEGVTAKSVRRALKGAKNATLIKLRVNSRGGDVFDGFAIYNLLAEHPARVEADVDALAASMASVIVMAADEIRMAANAMMMIHNPWTIALGEAEDLRGTADLLDKLRGQIADAYIARTKLARERVHEMMDAETWLTGAQALELGFADVVKPNKGAESAKALAALDLRGFERAPAFFAAAIADARAELARPSQRSHRPGGASPEDRMTEEEKALRRRLGLAENATHAEVVRAMFAQLDQLVPRADLQLHLSRAAAAEAPRAALAKRLGLAADAGVDVVLHGALAQLEKSERDAHEGEVKATIDGAVKAGKIAPASAEHYRKMCSSADGLGNVKALFASLPSMVGDDPRRDADPPGAKGSLSPQQKRIAAELGLKEDEYLASLKDAHTEDDED